MPFLTPEKRAQFLQQNGYDPTQYSYDEDTGNVYKEAFGVAPQPTQVAPEPALTPGWKVGLKSAISSALPTAGALVAGSIPQRIISGTALGARLGPWGAAAGFGLGLGSAFGGGYLASKLQNAVLPQSVQNAIYPTEQEIAAHPYWDIAGRAASLAPFFSPTESLSSLGRAGKTLKDLAFKPTAAYRAVTPAEVAGLKNVAINTGVNVATQAGLNTAQQLRGDQPFNYGELARESALGALFNEPTKFGQKTLGFKPTYSGVPTREELIGRNEAELSKNLAEPPLEPSYRPFEGPINEPRTAPIPPPEPAIPAPPPPAPRNDLERILNDPSLSIEQKQAMLGQQQPAIQAPVIPSAPVKAKGKAVEIQQRQEYEPGKQGPFKYQEETPAQESFSGIENEINTLLAKRGIKRGQYRVVITDKEGKPILGSKGKPIAGQANYPKREVSFGEQAGADTGYHEPGHIYFEDLARSTDPRDKQLIQEVLKEQGHPESVDEYVALNDKAQQGDETAIARLREIEEPIMKFVGEEGAARTSKGGFRQYLRDYLSRFGLGKEPARQQLSASLEHEVPFGERPELTKGKEQYAPSKIEVKTGIPGERQEGDISGEGTEAGTSNSLLNKEEGIGEKEVTKEQDESEYKKGKTFYHPELGIKVKKATEYTAKDGRRMIVYQREDGSHGSAHIDNLSTKKPKDFGKQQEESIEGKKEAPVVYKGYQPGFGKIEGFHLYNLKETLNDKLVKDSTVTEKSLKEAGYSIPELEKAKAITPESEGKQQEESSISEHNEIKKKPYLSAFLSATDKIGAGKTDYTHKKVAERTRNFFDKADLNYGRYGQASVRLFQQYKPEEVKNVYRAEWERRNDQPASKQLTPREKELSAKLEKNLDKIQGEAERLDYDLENFKFNNIDPDVLYKIDQDPTSIEAKSALRKWKDWIVKQGVSESEAKTLISSWQKAHRSHGDIGGAKIEEYGLPWELVDKNAARAMLRYGRKVGNKLAYYEHLQSDPEMRKALGINDPEGNAISPDAHPDVEFIGNEKNVTDVMNFAYNLNKPESPRLAATARLAGNLVMGPGTALRNLVSVPGNLAPYDVKFREVLKGLSNLTNNRERAYEAGAIRSNPSEYEFLGDVGNPDPYIKNLDKMSAFLRKWQGRDVSDRFEGHLIYSIGEEWAKTKLLQAKGGDKEAIRLLERVAGKKDYGEDIQELAKGFTNLVRGSYGPQGLPSWMLTGNLAPFVALNKFSVEKWNNVYKDVVGPMKKGNFLPFLKYTLTGLGSGIAIEQLNELLSGKPGSDLNVKEALAAYAETQDPEILASKVIGLAQMASYAGVVGDMAKLGIRAAEGKSPAYNNPISFPLYTLVTQTLAENLSGAAGAIKNGEDPIDVLSQFVKEVAVQSTQSGRYLQGQIGGPEEERKKEFSDIRKYEEATGRRENQELGQSRPNIYENLEAREFKRTGDLEEAAGLLPSLVQKAFDKAEGDPYRLKSELQKLKQNQYRTFPSLANQPLEFFSYLEYLRKTKGDDVASERLTKFLQQGAVNKAKAQLVP